MHVPVVIVGAGPAGLMLSHLLHQAGIASVIVERRSREYVESRVRAGVIEHWAAELMDRVGVGARMRREGLIHRGIHLSFDGALHDIDFQELVGKTITVYGQQEVVKDLIAARLGGGGDIRFEAEAITAADLGSSQPHLRYSQGGSEHELTCDFLAGCDGFHGICRPAAPSGALTVYDREYPFAWLGILAEAPPISEELIYAYHQRGFALFSMRSPTLVRLYIQCRPDEDVKDWPDERVWDELHARLGGEHAGRLVRGPVQQKSVTGMRSFVIEPMQYGRLFLAGDAAHIVPPTGAKGMNLAMADVLVLSRALSAFYQSGRDDLLKSYSATCLARIWKAQRFSWWMTSMLHLFPNESPFDRRRQLTELRYLASSRAAQTALAENYVGLPMN
jgi:p-hydroxybenzoate 3-monooxygenase